MNKKFFPEPVEALLFTLLVITGTFILTFSLAPVLTDILEDKQELEKYFSC